MQHPEECAVYCYYPTNGGGEYRLYHVASYKLHHEEYHWFVTCDMGLLVDGRDNLWCKRNIQMCLSRNRSFASVHSTVNIQKKNRVVVFGHLCIQRTMWQVASG